VTLLNIATPLRNFLFEKDAAQRSSKLRLMWLSVAVILITGYLVFGLILIGLPEYSGGASKFAVALVGWAFLGFLMGTATLRPVLLLPLLFYFITVMSGFNQPVFPIDYIGKISTVWLAAISIGFFLMNGVSVKIIIAGLLAVFVANMLAISVGYEGYQVVTLEQSVEATAQQGVQRSSGLAGQSNLLLILCFTLPFAVFLLERKVNMLVYIALAGVCIATTVLTGSRSGIVLSALFVVFGGLFLLKSGRWKFFLIFVGIIVSIFALQYLNNPNLLSKIHNSPLGDVVVIERTIDGLEGLDSSADTRESLVSDSWQYYAEQPLLGYGPDMYSEVVGQGFYAHNNFVEIGINWGLVGQVSYYLSYLAILVGMFKSNRVILLTPLLFLIVADQWFVLFLERPAVLLLCALLAVSSTPRPHRSVRQKRKRRSRRSKRSRDKFSVSRLARHNSST